MKKMNLFQRFLSLFKKKPLTLFQKLHKIQSEIKGLGKDKDSHNFQYVTGNKLISYIKPLMNELGLLLKQEIMSIDNERMDYQVWDSYKKALKDKSEILSKVMMRFTWIDIDSGETDVNSFGANGQNDWEKGLGSALTYAERYFLMKYFHIATDEDDIDNPDRKPEDKEPQIQGTTKPKSTNPPVETKAKPKETTVKKEVEIIKRPMTGGEVKNDWNGKIYSNKYVFVKNVKLEIGLEQIEKLKTHSKYTQSEKK